MSSLDGTTRPVQSRPPATRQGTGIAGKTAGISSGQQAHRSGNNLPQAANPGPGGPAQQAADTTVDVREAARTIASFVQNVSRELRFSVDESLGRTVVTVMDQNTEQVIRQIPSEEVLELARYLEEKTATEARGLLINREA